MENGNWKMEIGNAKWHGTYRPRYSFHVCLPCVSVSPIFHIVCDFLPRQKIGNFKIEPPGLFRGRGDHPKQGKIKVGVVLCQWVGLISVV